MNLGAHEPVDRELIVTTYEKLLAAMKEGEPVLARGELWLKVASLVPRMPSDKLLRKILPEALKQKYAALCAASVRTVKDAIRAAIAEGGYKAVRAPHLVALYRAHGWSNSRVGEYARSVLKQSPQHARPKWKWNLIVPFIEKALRDGGGHSYASLAQRISSKFQSRGDGKHMSPHTLASQIRNVYPELAARIKASKRRKPQ